jgi:hypothetical protein
MMPALFTRMSTRPPAPDSQHALTPIDTHKQQQDRTLAEGSVDDLVSVLDAVVIGHGAVAPTDGCDHLVSSQPRRVVHQHLRAELAQVLGVGATQAVAGACDDRNCQASSHHINRCEHLQKASSPAIDSSGERQAAWHLGGRSAWSAETQSSGGEKATSGASATSSRRECGAPRRGST